MIHVIVFLSLPIIAGDLKLDRIYAGARNWLTQLNTGLQFLTISSPAVLSKLIN